MLEQFYSDILIEHVMCPRNAGVIKDFNGQGKFGGEECSDYLEIFIRAHNEIIEDISFLVKGCPAAIATSSITTELAKGKTLQEAMKLTEDDIITALGGLPEEKKHCSNLGVKALKNAIEDYHNRKSIK